MTVAIAGEASLSLVKTSDANGTLAVGDTITYTVTAENNGTLTLHDVNVSDSRISPSTKVCSSVAPQATCVLSGEYTVTQADVDAGTILNTAQAKTTETNTTEANLTVAIAGEAAIAIVKTASLDGKGNIGDHVTYTFIITNLGNVTLDHVKVDDVRIGVENLLVGELAVGESKTVTANYIVTAEDVKKRSIVNQAIVIGVAPNGMAVADKSDNNSNYEDDKTVTPLMPTIPTPTPTPTPIPKSPAIAIVKTASLDGKGNIGDHVTYTFIITNLGNVTLDHVKVDDVRIGVENLLVGELAVGESKTVTANYIVTAEDVKKRSIVNQAIVIGVAPNGMAVADKSDNNSNYEDDKTVTPLMPTIPTPTPTPIQKPTPTPTATPKPKPIPKPKPTATPKPKPSSRPEATATVTPTAVVTCSNANEPIAYDDTQVNSINEISIMNVQYNDVSQMPLNKESIRLIDTFGDEVTTLDVEGKGTWDVDIDTGEVRFTPVENFVGEIRVPYIVKDSCDKVSNQAIIIVIYNRTGQVPINIIDNGSTLSFWSIFLLMLLTGVIGLYDMRKKEINKK